MAFSIRRFKPGAKHQTHLLLSALLWTAIGILLLVRGSARLGEAAGWQPLIVSAALLTGSLKAYFILDRAARRGISRILSLQDGTCLGAVYSVKTWLMVLCMMGMGGILRHSSLPGGLLSFLYLAIGWALLVSSRLAWWVWLKER